MQASDAIDEIYSLPARFHPAVILLHPTVKVALAGRLLTLPLYTTTEAIFDGLAAASRMKELTAQKKVVAMITENHCALFIPRNKGVEVRKLLGKKKWEERPL